VWRRWLGSQRGSLMCSSRGAAALSAGGEARKAGMVLLLWRSSQRRRGARRRWLRGCDGWAQRDRARARIGNGDCGLINFCLQVGD
jgi:hypothetical protein